MDYARMSAVVGDMVASMVKVRENTETLTKHIEDILFVVQEKIEEVKSEQAQPAEAQPTPEAEDTLEDKLEFVLSHIHQSEQVKNIRRTPQLKALLLEENVLWIELHYKRIKDNLARQQENAEW